MNIKNDVYIERLDDMGRGLGYINNKVIFIPNTLSGEIVDVEIVRETSKYLEGKVIKYIKISDKRVISLCPYYDKCGGCSLLHLSYEGTIDYKKNKIKNILNKFAKLDIDIEVIKNDKTLNYRNKIELKVENGLWGYYNSNTHDFVDIKKCLLAKDSINNVLSNKELINIKNGSIIIRSNYNDEILLSIKSNDEINIDIESLKKNVKLVGIVFNDKLYYGETYFIEKYNDKLFKVNYNSFFQVNEYITNKMIDTLNLNVYGNKLLDLYCGVGFLGQCINNRFNKIYGIEINQNSIVDAVYNAKLNKITNAYYMCGDASKVIDKINDNIDVMIIDPPRTGLVKNMINDVININAKELVYISCDPISLARDLNKLQEVYKVKKMYILDMFSYTYHVESLVILVKK